MNNATAPTEEAISIYAFFMDSDKVVITNKFIFINYGWGKIVYKI